MKKKKVHRFYSKDNEPIQLYFNLTYAPYLVIPRSVLQSMSVEWQQKFTALLEEIEAHEELHCPKEGTYTVYLRDDKGRFVEDFFRDYERGRRNLLTDK